MYTQRAARLSHFEELALHQMRNQPSTQALSAGRQEAGVVACEAVQPAAKEQCITDAQQEGISYERSAWRGKSVWKFGDGEGGKVSHLFSGG